MKRIVMIGLLFSIILTGLYGCGFQNNVNGKLEKGIESSSLQAAQARFAFELFKAVNQEDAGDNVFISPFSIATALTMTYNGAEGSTKEAMGNALSLSNISKDEYNNGYAYLQNHLENVDKKVALEIANSIWYRQGDTIQEEFLTDNASFFDAYISSIDFSKETSADTINDWIAKSTHDKIDKMLAPPIPSDVVMYLINAIYFKGDWTKAFDEQKTFDASFLDGNGNTQTIKMMNRKDTILYGSGEDYEAVKLPYGNEKTAMYCILPGQETNINDFIEGLDISKWNEITSSLHEIDDVVLQLPRFKMEYGIKNLNKSLIKLGMGEAFSSGADFSGIRDGIYISRVLHKAVIEVNEQGSEAAGATVVEIKEAAAAEPIMFRADRPFLFFIVDDESGSILFMGKAYSLDGSE